MNSLQGTQHYYFIQIIDILQFSYSLEYFRANFVTVLGDLARFSVILFEMNMFRLCTVVVVDCVRESFVPRATHVAASASISLTRARREIHCSSVDPVTATADIIGKYAAAQLSR